MIISYFELSPAFAVGLERSGKPIRQHALVKRGLTYPERLLTGAFPRRPCMCHEF